jgi:hypothetical protein
MEFLNLVLMPHLGVHLLHERKTRNHVELTKLAHSEYQPAAETRGITFIQVVF